MFYGACAVSKSASSSSSVSLSPLSDSVANDEQEQVIIARYLATLKPLETNRTPQRESRLGRGSVPVRRDIISYSGGRSLYSLQHHNAPISQFSPELSLYQTCAEARASQQCLLALSSLPAFPPRPQFFPFIRSIFQPDHGHYFLAPGQEPVPLVPEIGPFLCFSNHVMPPFRSISQVTIQEIEEHSQIDDKWPKGDQDSDSWITNSPSNVPRLSPIEVSNSSVSLNSHSEQRMQEMLGEIGEERGVSSAPNARNSSQFQGSQIEQCKFTNARFRPQTISTDGPRYLLQSPHSFDYVQPHIRPPNPHTTSSSGSARSFTPASFAPPVTIRTAGAVPINTVRPESSNPRMCAPLPTRIPPSACRTWPERTRNTGGTHSVNYMAPAVHIRSVVPVCSAPPARSPSPCPERLFSGPENPEEPKLDISAASSDLDKLQI